MEIDIEPLRFDSSGLIPVIVQDALSGEVLIAACIEHNLPYSVLPGASAVLMAAVMSGLPAMPFSFYGFFPREKKAQKPLLEQLKRLDHLVLFYESPNRVHATLVALLDALGDLDAAVLVAQPTKDLFQ